MGSDTYTSIKRGLKIALAVVVTLCVLESMARMWVVAVRTPTSNSAAFDVKLALAEQPTPVGGQRIFLVGDSKTWHGLFPELLQARLKTGNQPVMVTNLGVSAATPKMNHVILASALAHGVKPDVVVYNISPMLVNRTYFRSPQATAQQPFDHSYFGRCRVPKLLGKRLPIEKRLSCGLEQVSVLFQQRAVLADLLRMLARNGFMLNRNPLEWRSAAFYREVSVNGWSPDTEVMADLKADMDIAAWVKAVQQAESLTPFVQDTTEIANFIRYCRQQHIPVVLLWLPEHPLMEGVYRTLEVPEPRAIERIFEALADPSGETPVWFSNQRTRDSDATHYYNPDHQNVLGAIPATERLAQFLRQSVWPTLKARKQHAGATR